MFSRRAALRMLAGAAGAAGLMGIPQPKSLPESKEASLFKLGKQPASPPRVSFRDYITPDLLPPLPSGDFGHYPLVSDWGMLSNGPDPGNPPTAPNGVGCCTISGPYHGLQLFNKMADVTLPINDNVVLTAYAAITGYDPNQYNPVTDSNPTDRGSNVQDVAEYWRTTGLADAAGRVHKIDAYVALEPGNPEELFHAIHLFDAVGIGVNFPREWMNAFNAGIPWDAVPHPHVEGGHLITGVGVKSGMIPVVTWGKIQLLTVAGYEQFNDESLAYLCEDKLVKGKDIDGFDLAQLKADLQDIVAG